MAYFRLNQILREDDDQTVVCRTRLRDRLIAGFLVTIEIPSCLFFALFTCPARLPFLPPYYSANSWPLFFFFGCFYAFFFWWVFSVPYTLRLNFAHRSYRMTRGFFPFVLVNSGPLEDVCRLWVLRAYQTGNFFTISLLGSRVCTYSIQLEWKKMQWLYQLKIARSLGFYQESTVTLGTTEDLDEAEAKAQEIAIKIGVPYTGMYGPRWVPQGNKPA